MAVFNYLIWLLCVVTIISKVQSKPTLEKAVRSGGVQDESINPNHSRHRRSAVVAGRWDKTTITYKVLNGPYAVSWQSKPVTLSKARVEELVDQAFAEWAPHCGLTFIRLDAASRERADILFSFGRGFHGDGDSFDGPGNIVAHADYPSETAVVSEVHFDNDETWVEEGDPRAAVDDSVTIFYPTALHEIGHALGLEDSDNGDTIMYGSDNPHVRHLALEDVKHMQKFYGISANILTELYRLYGRDLPQQENYYPLLPQQDLQRENYNPLWPQQNVHQQINDYENYNPLWPQQNVHQQMNDYENYNPLWPQQNNYDYQNY